MKFCSCSRLHRVTDREWLLLVTTFETFLIRVVSFGYVGCQSCVSPAAFVPVLICAGRWIYEGPYRPGNRIEAATQLKSRRSVVTRRRRGRTYSRYTGAR